MQHGSPSLWQYSYKISTWIKYCSRGKYSEKVSCPWYFLGRCLVSLFPFPCEDKLDFLFTYWWSSQGFCSELTFSSSSLFAGQTAPAALGPVSSERGALPCKEQREQLSFGVEGKQASPRSSEDVSYTTACVTPLLSIKERGRENKNWWISDLNREHLKSETILQKGTIAKSQWIFIKRLWVLRNLKWWEPQTETTFSQTVNVV